MKMIVNFFVVLIAPFAWSNETATIQQIKGQKAILVFDQPLPFSIGQKLIVSSEDGTELGNIRGSRNLLEKKNSIGLAGQFSSLKQARQEQQTSFSLSGTYAWNKVQYEFGPELTYSFQDTGTTTTTTLIGGYFDYNLIDNNGLNDKIYGGVARTSYGSEVIKSSDGKTDTGTWKIDIGGQAKFFLLSQVLALRIELLYQLQSVGKNNLENFTFNNNGLVLNLGLQHYF